MIISARRARNICSNHAILQAVPELLAAVEETVTAQKTFSGKRNCPDCQEAVIFSKAEQVALETIRNLSKDAISRLRGHMQLRDSEELYIYENVPGGAPRSILL